MASTGTEEILVAGSLSTVRTLYILLNTGLSRLTPHTGTFTSVTSCKIKSIFLLYVSYNKMKDANFEQIWSYTFSHCAVQICSGVLREGVDSTLQLSPESNSLKQNMEAGRCSGQSE